MQAAPGYVAGVPYINPPQKQEQSDWHTGICGCSQDCGNCCVTCLLPCVTFGQIAEVVDEGHSSCLINGIIFYLLLHIGCPCLYSCTYRGKLRQKFALPESPCNDCCVHWCCGPCALCQEYRELQRYGIDPTLGWEGNKQRFMVAPQAEQMSK